jgi:hypothetical protein
MNAVSFVNETLCTCTWYSNRRIPYEIFLLFFWVYPLGSKKQSNLYLYQYQYKNKYKHLIEKWRKETNRMMWNAPAFLNFENQYRQRKSKKCWIIVPLVPFKVCGLVCCLQYIVYCKSCICATMFSDRRRCKYAIP